MHDRVECGKDIITLTVLGLGLPFQLLIVLALVLCSWRRHRRLVRQAIANKEEQQSLLPSPTDSDKSMARGEAFEMRDDISWAPESPTSDESTVSSLEIQDPGRSEPRRSNGQDSNAKS